VATLTRPDRETRAAELFHALSDPIRLRVVALLRGGERCVCELTDELELAQSRLSWHLKTLKDAGFLTDRREGRWVYYTLDPSTIAEAEKLLSVLHPTAAASRRALAIKQSCC
jgi:ArsR family transcriptional regulator